MNLREKLKKYPESKKLIMAGDERILSYSEDTMMRGSPDAVLVARDEKDAIDALIYCNANKISVTFCGSQTSMTGASVPLEGLLISTEKLEGVQDIREEDGEMVVVTRAGTVVADLQKTVSDAGHFYPVAPTSRDECRIGANVNTNATGEDSYKYGPVREYVKRIELVLPNGEKRILERQKGEKLSWERNRAGYFIDWENPLDLIIGSEGTLGFVSNVTLKLTRPPSDFFSALLPFPSNWDALNFVLDTALIGNKLDPRTLELIDSGALEIMKTAEGFPEIPSDIKALLYVKQEYKNDDEKDRFLQMWFEKTIAAGCREFENFIFIAQTFKEKENFRLWRHRIPEVANEHGRDYWNVGGGKIGTDWWVPLQNLREMMEYFYKISDETLLPYMGYAHIGSGHPHTNYLAKNPEEKKRAHDALILCCKKAVELGGGVAGEHGIGKLHTDLLSIQYSKNVIEKMKKWKLEYDPNWILGKGNIFKL